MAERTRSISHSQENYRLHSQVIDDGTDDQLEIHGYAYDPIKATLYYLTAILSLGTTLLISHWKPTFKLRFTCRPSPLTSSTIVLIKDYHGLLYVSKILSQQIAKTCPIEQLSYNHSLNEDVSDLHNLVPALNLTFFIHKFMKYFWDEESGCFKKLRGLDVGIPSSDFVDKYHGLADDEKLEKLKLYGPNLIHIEVKSYLVLLIDEILNPFYIFQLASIILWSCDDYYYYASCILLISFISIGFSLYETKKQMVTLRNMVSESNSLQVTVQRIGKLDETEEIPASDLVPGDVLIIPPNGCLMSCDAVVTAGNCIVNEAMLTGESVPETKTPITKHSLDDETYDPVNHKRHTLFCGTQVIQTRFYGNSKVLAVVVRTGFSTSKGELVRSILFPKPMGFQFYKDSIRFVLLLFAFATVGMAYSLYLYISRHSTVTQTILKALDIITIVVPPALPAALTVGTVYAQGRLKNKGIFCISPPRINVSGKIKLMCFDKTGTLTEEGLDFWGLLPISKSNSFMEVLKDATELPEKSPLLAAMATCHSLTMIEGKLAGDPLDLRMFEATSWSLEEPGEDNQRFDMLMPTVAKPPESGHSQSSLVPNETENNYAMSKSNDVNLSNFNDQSEVLKYEVGIIRQFQFSSSLQRMSVVCRTLGSKHMDLYAKGAPEKIQSLCLPHTVPNDFCDVLRSYTLQGFRVLAVAYKALSPKLSWRHVQRVKRDEVECDLTFLGLVIMQNALKPETTPVISTLDRAAIRLVMVTGDNLLTALSVARECGMISNSRVIVVNTYENENGETKIKWEATGKEDSYSLKKAVLFDNGGYQTIDIDMKQNFNFVIDGKSYNTLRYHYPDEFMKVIVKGTIFARMSPDQKTHLVESLQSLGYIVGMCGDGANDCGALKAADIGISLSEAEASVAAPFTSNIPNIECVPVVIKEGRCAMATSFSLFKFIALYSLIQFVSVLILYRKGSNLGDPMFLYIDLALITSLAIVMGNTKAYPHLIRKRPLSNLISINNIASMFLQFILIIGFQIGAISYLETQKWYHARLVDNELVIKCWESTTVFLISSFQYLIVAVIYSKGPPYRMPLYTNVSYLLTLIVLTSFTTLLVFSPWTKLSSAFELMVWKSTDTFTFQYTLFMMAGLNLMMAIIAEFFVAQTQWLKNIAHFVTRKKSPKNKYKVIEKDVVDNFQFHDD